MHRCDKSPLLLASKYPDGLYLKLTLSNSCAKVTFAGENGADTGESDRETKAKPLPTVYEWFTSPIGRLKGNCILAANATVALRRVLDIVFNVAP